MKKLVGLLLLSVFSVVYSAPYSWNLSHTCIGYPTDSYTVVVKDIANNDSVSFFVFLANVYIPADYVFGSGRGDMTSGEFIVRQESMGLAMAGIGQYELYVVKYEKGEDASNKNRKFLFSYYPVQSGCVNYGGRYPGNECHTAGETSLFSTIVFPFSQKNFPSKVFLGNEYFYQTDGGTGIIGAATRHIGVRSLSLGDSTYSATDIDVISIDTSVVRTEQHLGVDSLTVNFFLASGVEITRSYFIGNGVTSVKPLLRITPSFQKFYGPNVVYDVMGRRIANTSRAVAGLNIVRLSNGTMVENMNINRLR